jgi:hypothetical protein
VLHLEAGSELDEPEVAVRVEQELHRANTYVAERPDRHDRGPAQLLAQRRIDGRGRRLLDDLGVAALHRTLALAERHHRAVHIGHDRDLDVPGVLHERLAEDLAADLLPGGGDRFGERHSIPYDPQTGAAAAGGGLDQHREVGDRCRVGERRQHRDAGLRHQRLRLYLAAEDIQRSGGRTDPDHAGVGDRRGEVGILGERAVAGMDGVRPGALCRGDQQIPP